MSPDLSRRTSAVPAAAPASIPSAPPLPGPRPLQRARDAAYRFIGYPPSDSPGTQNELLKDRFARGAGRFTSLGATQNATASHRTGLEINTIAINESGTHALLGGKEIFKTVKIENGVCVEELNLRTAIRSTPTQASGRPRQVYSIDIADVAWAKGDCGDYVAAATSSGKIILYDLGHAGLQAAQLHEHFRQVHKVTFNPHRGSLLLSGSQDGTVRLWDVRDARNQASTLQSKRKYSGQSDGVRDVKWSPTDGVDFAFGTDSGWLQRWDIRNLKAAKVKIPAHTLACNIIDWHPDGKHIASAGLDKTVRVWDLSTNRKGKASWEIKTPYPVLNARWRPSCESSIPQYQGWRQCTQLATAYDGNNPIVHIWDFRRPALPFRELAPYSSAPTDLLWHSQDLLWTVGREGVFLQSDVQHEVKVIDRRNVQSFAVSPLGDVNFFVQRRTQRRLPKLHHTSTDSSITHDGLGISPDTTFISRSWEDDSLDQSFLSVRPTKHHSRSNSDAKLAGLHGSLQGMIKLDDILHNRTSFSPQQQAVRGFVPYHADPDALHYIARNYTSSVPLSTTPDAALSQKVSDALDNNATVAEYAGQYRLAQTWRILRFSAVSHLRERAKHARKPTVVVSHPTTDARAALTATSVPMHSRVSGEQDQSTPRTASFETAPSRNFGCDHEVSYSSPSNCQHDIEAGKPFTLVEMMHELLTSHSSNAQFAAHLITLLVPLLPTTHPLPREEQERTKDLYADALGSTGYLPEETERIIKEHLDPTMAAGLQPVQLESILSAYHEQLSQNRLFPEAAHLRRLAYPAYPAVYEDFIGRSDIHIKCGECGKPFEIGTTTLKCGSCNRKQAKCPYCYETLIGSNAGKLMTACSQCNHSMHVGCSRQWFVEDRGEGCPVVDCICDCVLVLGNEKTKENVRQASNEEHRRK